MNTSLSYEDAFDGRSGSVQWRGQIIGDEAEFEAYMRDVVKKRLDDAELEKSFEKELSGLASCGMQKSGLENYLNDYAAAQDDKNWKIGEALAECILQEREGAVLPWNKARDEMKPKVSLPGTDIVGFLRVNGQMKFLFGETKTSADKSNVPPSVMVSGDDCMTAQLLGHLQESERQHVHGKVIRWLFARVKSTEQRPLFIDALSNHCHSNGLNFVLLGVLLRDTEPNEEDIKSPSMNLAESAQSPTVVRIEAVYLPVRINLWRKRMRA